MSGDEIAVIVTLLAAGSGLLGFLSWLAKTGERDSKRTEEEYENRERGPNLLGNAVMNFDQFIRSDMKNAIEYQQDAEQGHLPSDLQAGEKLPGSERND